MWFYAQLAQQILNGIYYIVPTYEFMESHLQSVRIISFFFTKPLI